MNDSDKPSGVRQPPEPAEVARRITVAAASLSALAQDAGLEIVARLLNLVRIEAEIKLSEIRFRPPVDDPTSDKDRDGRN